MFKGKLKNYQIYLLLFILSCFIMLFFTQSSPLFFTNGWNDANSYYTVGMGMNEGLVPYRDLVEQKGPIVYFVHGLAIFFFQNSFFGIYLFESLAISLTLYFAFLVYTKFFKQNLSLILTFLTFPFLVMQPYFRAGDSAEEFSYPALMYLLLFITIYFMDAKKFSLKHSYLLGITFAYVFWIKFTLIGGWLGLFLIFAIFLLLEKQYLYLLQNILSVAIGFMTVTVPIFVYFMFHQSTQYLIDAYFTFNIMSYPPGHGDIPFISKVFRSMMIVGGQLTQNWLLLVMILGGLLTLLLTNKVPEKMKWAVSVTFVCTCVIAFLGGKDYQYYFMVLLPFVVFGIISLGFLLDRTDVKINLNSLVLVGLFTCLLSFTFNNTFKTSRLFIKDQTHYQYIFAKYIKDSGKDQTLLNYGSLDNGIYKEANILPGNRYFHRQNVAYDKFPELMDEQKELIKNKEVQFVVIRTKMAHKLENLNKKEFAPDILLENYQVKKVINQYGFTYWLLELR